MSAEAFQKIITGLEEALALAKAGNANDWNRDMQTAPRGEYVTTTYTDGKGNKVDKTVYRHVKLILASPCGVVTVGRWLPNEDRWEMFTKAVPPIAWMPWPTSPLLSAVA